jgi:xanthine dehydrogenase accessory factor
MKELQVWRFLRDSLENGQAAGLMIVVDSQGSSPGRAGFKMAVGSDGRMAGSIGGGIMEHKLVEYVRDRLARGVPFWEVRRQVHSKEAAHDQSGMICSGEQTIALLQMTAQYRGDLVHIVGELEAGRKVGLRVDASGMQKVNSEKGEVKSADADGEGRDGRGEVKSSDADGESKDERGEMKEEGSELHFQQEEAGGWAYQETLGNWEVAHVIGAGHVGLEMCKVLAGLDFYVVNYDDRPGLNTMEDNAYAHRKVVTSYSELGHFIEEGPDVYVIVMTFGYRGDDEAVRALLGRRFRYFGMMGSAAKVGKLLGDLKRDGFAEADIMALRTPAGLVAHCKTPAEIAVSIAAEIVAVRNGIGDILS